MPPIFYASPGLSFAESALKWVTSLTKRLFYRAALPFRPAASGRFYFVPPRLAIDDAARPRVLRRGPSMPIGVYLMTRVTLKRCDIGHEPIH